MTKKKKMHIKRIKAISDLCEELVCLDDMQKWFVDDITDRLQTMNKYECEILINEITKRISIRR